MAALKILYAFLSVAGLGALLGLGLAFASKIFTVKKDERIENVEKSLPGINCGACGFAGCSSYAEAIVGGDVELTLCSPGGAEVAKALAAIMGVQVEVKAEKLVAQVHCRGGRESATYKFDYSGIQDCNALFTLYGGNKDCSYGCLGLGSCIRVCPVDAIDYTKDGLVWVNTDLCISCGKCIEICPTKVMKFIPDKSDFLVACSSKDKGAITKKYCSVGCIGCKICEKKSPEGGFVVENFLATINYSFTGERKSAADACPAHCIVPVSERRKLNQEPNEEG